MPSKMCNVSQLPACPLLQDTHRAAPVPEVPPNRVDRRELTHLVTGVTSHTQLPKPDGDILDNLAVYLELLVHWNKAFNLVGPAIWQKIFTCLAADSLYLADFLARLPWPAHPQIWDLGSGAGLPGIPLRLFWPRGEYWMVERREKKALFISSVLARLKLKDTSVFRGPVKDFFATRTAVHGKADGIVSRAFKPWPELLAMTTPHLSPGGRLIILASQKIPHILPPPWLPTDSYSYRVAGKKRFFWILCSAGN
jgi:16S rRNA (guanine527-N7)-methyltransferase